MSYMLDLENKIGGKGLLRSASFSPKADFRQKSRPATLNRGHKHKYVLRPVESVSGKLHVCEKFVLEFICLIDVEREGLSLVVYTGILYL